MPFPKPTRKLFKQFHLGGKEDLDKWRKTFIETLDLTEYAGAIILVGSWKEWQRWKKDWPVFRNDILPEWLDEMEVKIRSLAIMSLCKQAETEKGTAAAKWLAEGRYKPSVAGRPSNKEITRQAKIAAHVQEEVDDEVDRVINFKND